jgi:hypothetical protein
MKGTVASDFLGPFLVCVIRPQQEQFLCFPFLSYNEVLIFYADQGKMLLGGQCYGACLKPISLPPYGQNGKENFEQTFSASSRHSYHKLRNKCY